MDVQLVERVQGNEHESTGVKFISVVIIS